MNQDIVEDFTSVSDTGNFFDSPFFAESGFSPFFTGLSILIAGALLVLIGLAMLASLKGGAFRLPGAGQFILVVLGMHHRRRRRHQPGLALCHRSGDRVPRAGVRPLTS